VSYEERRREEWRRERGERGVNGDRSGEMERLQDGRSVGLEEELVQRRYMGDVREEMRRVNLRRILARLGEWAPDLKVRRAWMEEVESVMMQGD
jgi:hypothetical protein